MKDKPLGTLTGRYRDAYEEGVGICLYVFYDKT
jgi:hypothetical protein